MHQRWQKVAPPPEDVNNEGAPPQRRNSLNPAFVNPLPTGASDDSPMFWSYFILILRNGIEFREGGASEGEEGWGTHIIIGINMRMCHSANLLFHSQRPTHILMLLFFMLPTRRVPEALCFRVVRPSVRTGISLTQNLKSPLVDFYHTWPRGAPWRVDELIRFWARSAQGQRSMNLV